MSGPYTTQAAGNPLIVGGYNVAAGDWCWTNVYPAGVSYGQGVAPIAKVWIQQDGSGAAWSFTNGSELGGTFLHGSPKLGAMINDYHGSPPGSVTMVGSFQVSLIDAEGGLSGYLGGSDAMSWKTVLNGPVCEDIYEYCVCRIHAR